MAIVHRRVFYAKVGMADQLVKHLQEGYKQLAHFSGVDVKSRLLTDYMSGRSDRVVTEDEADDFGAFEKVYSLAMGNPEAQSWFPPWEKKLHEMIHYAEAENFTIR